MAVLLPHRLEATQQHGTWHWWFEESSESFSEPLQHGVPGLGVTVGTLWVPQTWLGMQGVPLAPPPPNSSRAKLWPLRGMGGTHRGHTGNWDTRRKRLTLICCQIWHWHLMHQSNLAQVSLIIHRSSPILDQNLQLWNCALNFCFVLGIDRFLTTETRKRVMSVLSLSPQH